MLVIESFPNVESNKAEDDTQMKFDHEKLHVYQASLEFMAFVSGLVDRLAGKSRFARDQLLRSSQSIALNIAEGNGKRSVADRKRYFEIAHGSAMESAATLDVIVAIEATNPEDVAAGKELLGRIVSMLTKMTEKCGEYVREDEVDYTRVVGCES